MNLRLHLLILSLFVFLNVANGQTSSIVVTENSPASFLSCSVLDEVELQKDFYGHTFPVIRLEPLCDTDFDIEMKTFYWDANGSLLDEDRVVVDTLGFASANFLNGNSIEDFRQEEVFHIEQILNVWESDSEDLTACLEILEGNHISREDSAVITYLQWGVWVQNSCDRALDVHFDYLAYDAADQLVRRFSAIGYPVPAHESRIYSIFAQMLTDDFERIERFIPEIDFVRPFAEEIDLEARYWSSNVVPVYDTTRDSVGLTATNSNLESFSFELVSEDSSENIDFSVSPDSLQSLLETPVVSGVYDNNQGLLSFPSLKLDTGMRFHSLVWQVEDPDALHLRLQAAEEGVDIHDYRGDGPKCVEILNIDSQVQLIDSGDFDYSLNLEVHNSCLWQRTYGIVYALLDRNFLGDLGRIEIVEIPPLETQNIELVGEIPSDRAYYPVSRESVLLIPIR